MTAIYPFHSHIEGHISPEVCIQYSLEEGVVGHGLVQYGELGGAFDERLHGSDRGDGGRCAVGVMVGGVVGAVVVGSGGGRRKGRVGGRSGDSQAVWLVWFLVF